jgi:hypothetical protein
MAEDINNQDAETPPEWQLANGKWEYVPLSKPISEVIDINDGSETATRTDFPVYDSDVTPINDQDDGVILRRDDLPTELDENASVNE